MITHVSRKTFFKKVKIGYKEYLSVKCQFGEQLRNKFNSDDIRFIVNGEYRDNTIIRDCEDQRIELAPKLKAGMFKQKMQ